MIYIWPMSWGGGGKSIEKNYLHSFIHCSDRWIHCMIPGLCWQHMGFFIWFTETSFTIKVNIGCVGSTPFLIASYHYRINLVSWFVQFWFDVTNIIVTDNLYSWTNLSRVLSNLWISILLAVYARILAFLVSMPYTHQCTHVESIKNIIILNIPTNLIFFFLLL